MLHTTMRGAEDYFYAVIDQIEHATHRLNWADQWYQGKNFSRHASAVTLSP